MSSRDTDTQLLELADNLNRFINDLDNYIHKNEEKRQTTKRNKQDQQQNLTNCRYISKDKSRDGKDHIMCYHIEQPTNSASKSKSKIKSRKRGKNKGKGKEKTRLADKPIEKKTINGKVMGKWGDEWLPVCDGYGFPYVEGCYSDASNWSPEAKQCIIENPGTTNLASGSLYTCGFLW